MSFGEHLDELRTHLLRALAGLVVGVSLALFMGQSIVGVVRQPIDAALMRHGLAGYISEDIGQKSVFDYLGDAYERWANPTAVRSADSADPASAATTDTPSGDLTNPVRPPVPDAISPRHEMKLTGEAIEVAIDARELAAALHRVDPERYPALAADAAPTAVPITIRAPEFDFIRKAALRSTRPVTFRVEEAFMTMLKVALVAGLVFSSPWVFWQIWQFVAVGLYPHERKFVRVYGAVSLLLFLIGGIFCYYLVFPLVLDFLLDFNDYVGVEPQIRLSEWVTFAITLPVMFGISFQLPLVMVFIEKLGIVETKTFREQRRMAILIISIASMFLTPADPGSMILMMVPLIILYEVGILMCGLAPKANPFEDDFATS